MDNNNKIRHNNRASPRLPDPRQEPYGGEAEPRKYLHRPQAPAASPFRCHGRSPLPWARFLGGFHCVGAGRRSAWFSVYILEVDNFLAKSWRLRKGKRKVFFLSFSVLVPLFCLRCFFLFLVYCLFSDPSKTLSLLFNPFLPRFSFSPS